MQVSISQLSDFTGRDRRTINKRIKTFLKPIGQKQGASLYDSKTACELIVRPDIEDLVRRELAVTETPDHAGGYDETVDKNRLQRAKAEMEELKLQEKKGELVPVDEILPEIEKEYSLVRTTLLAIPIKKAKALSVMEDPADIQIELEDSINEALEHLEKA